jgi:hypothetical protein
VFIINIIEKIFTAIITLIVTGIVSYFFYGYFLYPVQINSYFIETWNSKYNSTEYLNFIDFSNFGIADMSQVDLQVPSIGINCGNFIPSINNPKIVYSFLTKDCQIIAPTEIVGTNVLDIFCDRINLNGHFEISWESDQKPDQNCTYLVRYQLGINPLPYYSNVIRIERNDTFCGDSICTKNEVSNCCRDCGCGENQFCYGDNLCYLKEFHILNLSLVNQTLKVGDMANVTFGFQSNFQTNYSFTVFWKYENTTYYSWPNSSYVYGITYWGAWYPLNTSGNWTALIIANSTIGSDQKEINFNVSENPSYPKIVVIK